MLTDLRIGHEYDGFLFLSEAARNVPKLDSHHHFELELNLVVRGSITYVVGERCFTFPARTLLWLFPEQEHQLVTRSADAQLYVAVFKPSLIKRSCRTPAYSDLRRGNSREWRDSECASGAGHFRPDPHDDGFDDARIAGPGCAEPRSGLRGTVEFLPTR